MYSDKENINILTALLPAHSVRCAVVCPGSRNAAIVHNLHEAGLECHPVTDERSAGFYALGLALAKKAPVAVCVTSGTALLNTLPAVAEACHRHLPLVVISADRPEWAIGQLQGQTLKQPGALGSFVGCTVNLPEVHDAASRRYCERLANEALCEMVRHHPKPVHINVPLSEPLFRFTTPELPAVRTITVFESDEFSKAGTIIGEYLSRSKRPMVVLGQCMPGDVHSDELHKLSECMPVLYEPLSTAGDMGFVDKALSAIGDDERYSPDLIVYIGDTLVSNKLKRYLSSVTGARTVVVNADGEIHDVFGNLTAVIDDNVEHFVKALSIEARRHAREGSAEFRDLWQRALKDAREDWAKSSGKYNERAVVQAFENMLAEDGIAAVHYANSSAVRYATLIANHYVHVNRGVNGIEGSLSTAAGFSLGTNVKTYCVIGDLSFFYDCNALWNREIGSNLRILLLNNGGGKIFSTLPGLSDSATFPAYVAGTHMATARGICESYGVEYRSVDSAEHLTESLQWLVHADATRPLLLECRFA